MRLRVKLVLAAALAGYPTMGQAADAWANPQPVTVVMVDNHFQPASLTFRAGQAYQLRLENHGKNMHEFTAPGFLKAAKVQDAKWLTNGGTDVVVQPGKIVTILLIAPAKGNYDLSCADHDWDGMAGQITVN